MIATKFGTFNAVSNGSNGVCLYMANIKVAEFPKIAWWDKDKILKALDANEELINKRIASRVMNTEDKKVNVTRDNVKSVLEDVLQVLSNEEKGFYTSRIKQCLNKLG